MNAEDSEEVAGNGGSVQPRWLDGASDGGDKGVVLSDGEQRFVLRANVFKIRVGKVHAVAGCALLPQAGDVIGLRIRQRAEKDAVDNAEDGSGCADAEGERQDGGDGERMVFVEKPQGEAKVLQNGVEKGEAARIAVSLFGL